MRDRIVGLFLSLTVLLGVAVEAHAQSVAGEDRAQNMLSKLSSVMLSMPSYCVDFEAKAGEETLRGEYVVSGDRYHISLADMEVYGDAKLRYEVDKSKREVVVDVADTESHNLLSNPTHAFSFVGEEYRAELLSEDGTEAVLRLKSRDDLSSEVITITLTRRDNLPRSITYDVEGDRVEIYIRNLKQGVEPRIYDAARYADFEIIDFR